MYIPSTAGAGRIANDRLFGGRMRVMIRENSGVSMIEVMTVIAIIAIISAIAVPGYIGWLPKYRLSTSARDVLSDLEYARGNAVKENASVIFEFDTANNSYNAWVDNGALGNRDNWNQDVDERSIRTRQMPPDVNISVVSFPNDRVRFNGNGFPEIEPDPPAALGGGTITLTNDTGAWVVELRTGGKARIQ